MQHLFINVPKYVNHHMFIYVNILSELEKNKRKRHSHPRKSDWLFQRSVNLSVKEQSCGIRTGFRPSAYKAVYNGDYSTQFQD